MPNTVVHFHLKIFILGLNANIPLKSPNHPVPLKFFKICKHKIKPLKTNNQTTYNWIKVPPTYRHTDSHSTLQLFILNLKSRDWKTCKPSQNISYASVLSIIIKCYRGDVTHVLWAISCTFLIPSVMSIFFLTPFPPLSLPCPLPESLPL